MNIEGIVNKQRAFFERSNSKIIYNRKVALTKLRNAIKHFEKEILDALEKDLGKSSAEAYLSEVGIVYSEIKFALKNMDKWVKPNRKLSSLAQIPAKCSETPEPYGVVLIMAPWNYPIQLTLSPLVGAIAAGNCAIVKPSNYAPNSSDILARIIQSIYPPEYITVVQGGREENKELLNQRFDYIFFTGGPIVGRTVQKSAAEFLTPTTLELGGKSPCIVEKSANINYAAKRIVFGKFINSGQTCVAPDYLLVDEDIKEQLIMRIKYYISKQLGKNPLTNKRYSKIINLKHFNRLNNLSKDEKVILGGRGELKTLKIEPTLLDDVSLDSPVMQEEIFGPILPIISFKYLSEAEKIILSRPKPLALYLFTKDKEVEKRILNNISFGGGCINDTILHLVTNHMAFGGVGESGMGKYHGKYSFDTFSHYKSILKQSNFIDIPLRYPPYTKLKEKIIRAIM